MAKRKKKEDGLGIKISLMQITLITGVIVGIGAAWAVGGKVYSHFAKTAYVLQVEAQGVVNALQLRLFQIKNSLDGYRIICGPDFKKCPRPEDHNRVNDLLREQADIDADLRTILQDQRRQSK